MMSTKLLESIADGTLFGKIDRQDLLLVLYVALFAGIFYAIWTGLGQALRKRSLWIGIGLIIVFLRETDSRWERWASLVLIPATVVSAGYIFFNYIEIQERLIGVTPVEAVLGTLLIIAVLEGTRRSMESSGVVLALLGILSVLYMISGHLIGLIDQQIAYSRMIDNMYLSTSGTFSFILGTVIDYVIPFIVFGKTLEIVGGTDYFIDLSKFITRKMIAGPAKLAVVASALMGMISGTVVGNIATTGAVTIPTMKNSGVDSDYAAAIESAASTGGQIMPPIMGIAIFIMVNITGIPYLEIASRSLVPAVLYFLMIFLFIHLLAQRDDETIVANTGAESYEELPSRRELIKKAYFFIPVLAIVGLLVQGIPIPNTGIYATLLVIGVGAIHKEHRITLGRVRKIISQSMELSTSLIVITGTIGIIVGVMGSTGLSLQFTSIILSTAGGNTAIILLLTMIASLLLGMGMSSTVVAYILLATLIAPALVNVGFKLLVSHLFVFYFGMFALITPPVGVGVFTAAGMAGGDGLNAGMKAIKICLPGFLLPYLFVLNDGILLYGSWTQIGFAIATALVILTLFTVAQVGYLRRQLRLIERGAIFIGGLCGIGVLYYLG
jgi:TRAP transporter 4TM/12TM fusion protein